MRLFSGLCLIALVTACASNATPIAPAPLNPTLVENAGGGKLFVSNFYLSEILIYPANEKDPAPTGSISAGVSYPYNLAVDRHGTLYVQNNNNTITEYAKNGSGPTKTLTEPKAGYGTGINVAVGKDGTVYAVDHLAGQIYEFENGNTTATKTIGLQEAFGLALDRHNDLYVEYASNSSGGPGHVMEYKPGSTSGHDLGITIKYEGGLGVDSHDDLLVGDQGNQVIDIFKHGKNTPFRTISVSPYYPYQFNFDRSEKYLYMVSGTPAAVYVYDYSTGALDWTDNQGLRSSGYAEGVALAPAAPQ